LAICEGEFTGQTIVEPLTGQPVVNIHASSGILTQTLGFREKYAIHHAYQAELK